MKDYVPAWQWLNLSSLDAVLVALIWQDFLSRCYATPLLPAGRTVLGLTVWAIYIADKLMDVRGPAPEDELRHHRFYRRNKRRWTIALVVILAADALVILLWLRPAVFVRGLAVAAAATVYLFIFTASGSRWVFCKKACAAILFSSGVFLVASARGSLAELLWPWASFAALIGGNLALIQFSKQQRSARELCLPLLALALAAAIGHARWYSAIALSSAILAALAYRDNELSIELRRSLADLALFTPLLLRP